MSSTTEDAIVVERQDGREPLVFNAPEDVTSFLDREQEFWAWTEKKIRTGNSNISTLVARYHPAWTNSIRGLVKSWSATSAEADKQTARNTIGGELRSRFTNDRMLCARDNEAIAVAELARTDVNIAAVSLALLHGWAPLHDQPFIQHGKNLEGIAKGFAIAAQIDPSIVAGAAIELSKVRQNFENDANRLRAMIEDVKSQANQAQADIRREANELREDITKTSLAAEERRKETFEALRADIETLRRTYDTHMHLRGPAQYWKDKATRHGRWKWITLGLLVPYAALASWLLYCVYERAAAHLLTNPGDTISYAALFKAGAFALLLSSVAFWIGRVVLRIYLSNQHLQTDAQERTVMAMTFLSLIRNEAIKDDERKLILAPLFRSASDGIVKDDTSPDSALVALLTNLSKR